MSSRTSPKIFISTFLIAFSTLLMEIALTRIFSVISWHHFTPMIIGIAMLGFGIAGAYLTVVNRRDPSRLTSAFVARNAFGFGFSTLFAVLLVTRIHFEPLAIASDWTQLLSLLSFFVLLTVPFFFAGLCLGSIITMHQNDINRIYFSDLFGASIGSLISVPAIHHIGVTNIIFLIALLAGLTGLMMDSVGKRLTNWKNWLKVAFLVLCLAGGLRFNPYLVHVPASKPLFQFANSWKGAKEVIFSHWNVVARIDIIKPVSRILSTFSGDLGPAARNTIWEHLFICQDGQAATGILKSNGNIRKMTFLPNYLQAAPYVIKKNPGVLVIGIGGGIDGLIALYHNARHVTGVDVNPLIVEAITRRYAQFAGFLFNGKRVDIHTAEGRHFLSRNRDQYDVIQLSGVDTFTALASGAYALTENYLYTVEAIHDYWNHLTPEGVLSFSRWFFRPPRETLRLTTMMVQAMEEMGITDVSRHFVIINGRNWAETLLKKSPFTASEIDALRHWAWENDFQVVYDPDRDMNTEFDKVIRSDRRQREVFFDQYIYNIRPATDNRPFFFDYYKWSRILRRENSPYGYTTTNAPLSLRTLLLSLIMIMFLAAIGILYPQFRDRKETVKEGKLPVFLYFGALALGFMFVEIALIQQLMVFLGGPTYSFSISLFSILFFSGLGSYFTKRLKSNFQRILLVIPLLLVLLTIIVSVVLSWAIPHWLNFSLPLRSLLAVLVLSPLAFVMGMPFPLGIRLLGQHRPGMVTWGWTINSFMTVFASLFCIFLSMLLGFRSVFMIAGVVYLIGFLSFLPVLRHKD